VPPIPDEDDELTVIVNPRIAEGYFVAWKGGELMSWGHMGAEGYPDGADTVAISPADFRRLMQVQARFKAEALAGSEEPADAQGETAHGRA
jgi:hypothetical protein